MAVNCKADCVWDDRSSPQLAFPVASAQPALKRDQDRRYFTRRPLKNPAFVVFCLILAVSPCSAEF
jgi:hypothetical protein